MNSLPPKTPALRKPFAAVLVAVMMVWFPAVRVLWGPLQVGNRLRIAIASTVVYGLIGSVLYGFVRGLQQLARWPGDHRRETRQWRLDHQKCIECGYDVRATPGRCPECGAVQVKWWA